MMKKIMLICILAMITLAGLSACGLQSNYESAMKEAESRNAAIEAADSAPMVIDLTGPSPDWTEEVLMGLVADGNELTVRVGSGGCTKKEDFWVWCHYDEASDGRTPHYVLTIYRTRKDECKALVWDGVEIKYSLKEELGLPGLYTYSVTNKIGVGVSLNK